MTFKLDFGLQGGSMANDLWIIAPTGVSFRSQPSSTASVVLGVAFGQHVTALNTESVVDASGRSWLQVRTDSGSIGFIAASLNGDRLVSNTKPVDPFVVQVLDTQVVRDAGGLAVRDRRDITLNPIDQVQPNEKLTVFVRLIEADNTPWLWVLSPRGQYGWAREQVMGVTLVSKAGSTLPPTNATTPTSTTDVWVNSDIGLNFRDRPSGNLIAVLPNGQHLTAIGSPNPPDANGTVFQQVRTDAGQTGYVAAVYQGLSLLTTTQPIPPVSVVPWGKCLAGVGMADPRPFNSTDKSMIQKSKIEAFKIFTLGDADETKSLINDLRKIRADMFIVARLFFKPDADNKPHFSPQNFVDTINTGMSACYAAAVRYFEVHNEPNLTDEGMGWNWTDGTAFGTWLIQVLNILRLKFPEAKLGYPGLSPQPNVPGFINGSASAIAQCDWIGAHCYWQTPTAMQTDSDGLYWRRFRAQFPDKLLMITEFSNNTANVSADQKGQQYAQYYQLLRHENNLGAAFSFALNWPGQDQNREGWVFNNGETAIGTTVGAKINQAGFLA
jgi:hypothetical protein